MTYQTGSWGEQARERYLRRKKAGYWKSLVRKKRAYEYDYKQTVGANIPQNMREHVLHEQGLRCQLCGKPQLYERYRGLHIHHKDKNRKNNSLDNLIVLCRSCHSKQHARNFAGRCNPMYGRKQSEKTKLLIKEKALERVRNGWISPMQGKIFSLEHRLKLSQAALQRNKRK